jgi:MFS family permease
MRQISRHGLTVSVVCLIAWTLTNMDQSLFGYAIPGLMRDLDLGLREIGWTLSVAFIFAAFSTIVIGVLADTYGRRIMLALCLGASAFFVAMHAFIPGLLTLMLVRSLAFGLSNGLSPITNTYVAEVAPARYRGLFVGILQCGYPLGWFIAAMVTAPLMSVFGWRAIFLVALAVIPIAVVIYRVVPESQRFESARAVRRDTNSWLANRARLAELFTPPLRRRTLICALAFFLFGGAYAGSAFYFPTYFAEAKGYSAEEATMIVGISYGIGVIGYIAAAFVGEFLLTRRNTVVVWCFMGAATLLYFLWFSDGFWSDLILFGVMASFFYGTSAVLTTFMAELFPTHLRATGAAVSASAGMNLGFATFPVIVSASIENIGWTWAFTIWIAPPLILCGIAVLFLENLRSGQELDELAAVPKPI